MLIQPSNIDPAKKKPEEAPEALPEVDESTVDSLSAEVCTP